MRLVFTLKGNNVVDFKENSRKEAVAEFLHQIRKSNPKGKILIILDNSKSHHAQLTIETARKLNINLVFLPSYSPDLNPIEFIWKTVKRELSSLFIETKVQIRKLIQKYFIHYSESLSFARKWIKRFMPKVKKV